MNARNEDKFTSKELSICGAKWILNCYPNGYEKDDKMDIAAYFYIVINYPFFSFTPWPPSWFPTLARWWYWKLDCNQ